LFGHPRAGWVVDLRRVEIGLRGQLIGVVILFDFVYDLRNAPLTLEVELFGREGLSHSLRHIDWREILAQYFLNIPGGDERLVGRNEDGVLLDYR
jgi:hypothetical protein